LRWSVKEAYVQLSRGAVVAGLLLAISAISPAAAATYNYVGNADPISGNYLTATVELTCSAPCTAGAYDPFGANPGISSFSLSAYSNADVLLATVSSQDHLSSSWAFPAFEFNFYLVLGQNGEVTNWSMYRYGRTANGDDIALLTMGSALPGLGRVGDALVSTQFGYLNGALLLGWSESPVGVWSRLEPQLSLGSASEVPLPAALPLFASVVAGGGVLAWRRRRNASKNGDGLKCRG
jgi:hypothetical protein